MDARTYTALHANFVVAGAAGTPVGGNIARDGAERTLFHGFRHVPGDDLVVGLDGVHHFSKGGSTRMALLAAFVFVDIITVSYTHLTLPTIYSV